MSRADREKWDAKHAAAARAAPCPRLVELRDSLPLDGRALDLACGGGANALWICEELGLTVDAIDASRVALAGLLAVAEARGIASRVHPVQMDLDSPAWRDDHGRYALVVVVAFLDRALLPRLPALLRPGGLLFYETFRRDRGDVHPAIRPEWTLEDGELPRLFPSLAVIRHVEDGPRAMLLAARRIQ